jgi:type I restriction enzyme R subunit
VLNEADTRAKLIDPALHACGWSEDMISREVAAPPIEIVGGRARRRRGRGRVDYLLQAAVVASTQPIKIALIEAKENVKHPGAGLDQGKQYAVAKRLNVPFVYSSNGHQFVEFDATTGLTSEARPMSGFPTPADLLHRWQEARRIDLADPAAAPLMMGYVAIGDQPRYYQDAAIRAALEKIGGGGNRVLLSLATGTGKTLIAAHLLHRIADAGQLRRALFICDRDELRTQGVDALQKVFGGEVAPISARDLGKNARIAVATYQTLGLTDEESDAEVSLLVDNFEPDHFSHIVIDEAHRSAWGKWREVLEHNPNAVHIGLTATPRQLVSVERNSETEVDEQITADNIAYFGEPVYEYSMAQAMEDGFLAACEIVRRDIFLDRSAYTERETGLAREDLAGKDLRDARTGEALTPEQAKERYAATAFEDTLLLPERLQEMAEDLFRQLLRTGGPEQKTIIFCARDRHAHDVAVALNNRYVAWCQANDRTPASPYAFRCTANNEGRERVADFKASRRHHWIAATVDLLTTGVDVPAVQNVVFFRYVRSPIAFTQMLGRGTRIDPATDKLMFRVYDYTNATRLLGGAFMTRLPKVIDRPETPKPEPEQQIEVRGFSVRVSDAGHFIIRNIDGKATPVALEEYEREIAERLKEDVTNLEALRDEWVEPPRRRLLLERLPDGESGLRLVQELSGLDECDLYDVLAQLAFDTTPLTRPHRAFLFDQHNTAWLEDLPTSTAATVRALVAQFARAGTEGLERKEVFQTPDVAAAGGITALAAAGDPAGMLRETKARVLA